jgi:predicted permease
MIDSILQDVRFSVRTLRNSPGFALIAVLTLALGIGANTTIFSWINSTLLNPIPGVSHTSSLVSLMLGTDPSDPGDFSYPDYVDMRDHSLSFTELAAYDLRPIDLSGHGKPERIWGSLVSANYFEMLRLKPILGRTFVPADGEKPGGAPYVVISYRFWQTHFGGDRGIIGRTIDLNQHPYTIVGVTPPLFQGTQTGLRVEIWAPLMMQQQLVSSYDRLNRRDASWVMVLGRLRANVSFAAAQAEMGGLFSQLVSDYPNDHRGRKHLTVFPLWRAPFGANGYLYILLPMLMAIAGVVLLLACANVANLLLVRAVSRQREIAIRLSMGANRGRLVRQMLIESAILALVGGALAVFLTLWTSTLFAKFMPASELPLALDIRTDSRVLLATVITSLFTAIFFGLLPALRSSKLEPAAVLKMQAPSASAGCHKARLASGLVVAQISMSLPLLVCAGLFIRAFEKTQKFDLGFNPDHVLIATFDLFPAGYNRADGLAFQQALMHKLQTAPRLESAALADWVPLGFAMNSTFFQAEGYEPQPHESMQMGNAGVSPDYFRTMRIPLVSGRTFIESDTDKAQNVAIVNQAFAARYWPGRDPMGRRLNADGAWRTVVGIAQNSQTNDLSETPVPFIYLPILQDYSHTVTIHARVAGDPLAYAPAIEKAVHELNADLPVYDVGTLKARVQVVSTNERIAGTFVGCFGVLALALAAIGIYGVIAYTTRQRTHEIGIRMALGAQQKEIFDLIVGQGLRLAAIGLGLGLVVSFALTPFLRSLLFGVTTTDPLTFSVVLALLSAAALIACYLPARRAMLVDPIELLRHE